ncbi:MAG: hypothetical protein LM587_00725 [Candidatus Aenigmarchaeota archaeon]|nr:hypothetical protein [Candidatus Aenigmarchaeota archaeon]
MRRLFKKLEECFSLLPFGERKLPIVKVNGKFYTWEEVYKEVERKSELARKMIDELKKMGLI